MIGVFYFRFQAFLLCFLLLCFQNGEARLYKGIYNPRARISDAVIHFQFLPSLGNGYFFHHISVKNNTPTEQFNSTLTIRNLWEEKVVRFNSSITFTSTQLRTECGICLALRKHVPSNCSEDSCPECENICNSPEFQTSLCFDSCVAIFLSSNWTVDPCTLSESRFCFPIDGQLVAFQLDVLNISRPVEYEWNFILKNGDSYLSAEDIPRFPLSVILGISWMIVTFGWGFHIFNHRNRISIIHQVSLLPPLANTFSQFWQAYYFFQESQYDDPNDAWLRLILAALFSLQIMALASTCLLLASGWTILKQKLECQTQVLISLTVFFIGVFSFIQDIGGPNFFLGPAINNVIFIVFVFTIFKWLNKNIMDLEDESMHIPPNLTAEEHLKATKLKISLFGSLKVITFGYLFLSLIVSVAALIFDARPAISWIPFLIELCFEFLLYLSLLWVIRFKTPVPKIIPLQNDNEIELRNIHVPLDDDDDNDPPPPLRSQH